MLTHPPSLRPFARAHRDTPRPPSPPVGPLVARATAAFAVALLAGCSDTSPGVTAPRAAPAAAARRGAVADARPGDPLATRLSGEPGACLVGIRGTDGVYYSRSVKVALPQGIDQPGGPTTRLGYRGWASGSPEPVQIAVCTIPDTPAARQYLEQRLNGRPMNAKQLFRFAQLVGVADVDGWRSGQAPTMMPGRAPIELIDGVARTPVERPSPAREATRLLGTASSPGDVAPMMVTSECDPSAIIPDPGCEGWTPEPEPEPPTEPPPASPDPETGELLQPGEPSFSVELTAPNTTPNICNSGTATPHLSGTPGFLMNVNVHSYGKCQRPVRFQMQTWLTRWKCTGFLWMSCGYKTIATGLQINVVAASTDASIATTNCTVRRGWYAGCGMHFNTSLDTGNQTVIRTKSNEVEILCGWISS